MRDGVGSERQRQRGYNDGVQTGGPGYHVVGSRPAAGLRRANGRAANEKAAQYKEHHHGLMAECRQRIEDRERRGMPACVE